MANIDSNRFILAQLDLAWLSSDQLNSAWLSLSQLDSAQIDLIELLDFWMESVASERRPIVQILLKFFFNSTLKPILLKMFFKGGFGILIHVNGSSSCEKLRLKRRIWTDVVEVNESRLRWPVVVTYDHWTPSPIV